MSDFSTLPDDNFKEIISMFRRRANEPDYSAIRFLDDKVFHDKYGYVDYTDRGEGYPIHYTRLGDKLIFNCPASEDLIIRVWYQRVHPPFTDDTTPHSFPSRDNMIAFQAIVYQALVELKNSMNCIEFTKDLQAAAMLAERYTRELILRDQEEDFLNEDMNIIGWAEREDFNIQEDDPYSWV